MTEQAIASDPRAGPVAPVFPCTSVEFVNAMAHFYRGELARMASWRDRLDRTTNWAIAASAAMLSVSLSNPESHHGVLLFAMVLVFLLLAIESRRYRFFDCYRNRVRLIERSYFAHVFAPRADVEPAVWMAHLADDLRRPRFAMPLAEAMSRRLRRNYVWLFVILLLAWVLKISSAFLQPDAGVAARAGGMLENAALGAVPGWAVAGALATAYAAMARLMLRYQHDTPGELGYGDVHV